MNTRLVDLAWVAERRTRRQLTPQKAARTKRPTIKALAKAWHCSPEKLEALVIDMAREKGLL